MKHIKEGILINWNNKKDPLEFKNKPIDVEVELWSLKKNKFQQIHDNKIEED